MLYFYPIQDLVRKPRPCAKATDKNSKNLKQLKKFVDCELL